MAENLQQPNDAHVTELRVVRAQKLAAFLGPVGVWNAYTTINYFMSILSEAVSHVASA
jgi:hypothetical protein